MLEELHLNPAWPDKPLLTPAAAEHAVVPLDLPALVADHSAVLFRVAFALLRDRTAAEDVVQETLLRVLHHRASLPAIRELRPWLVRIAWRLALDHRRRHKPEQMDDLFAATLIAPGLSPEAALAQTRSLTATLREIDRLPDAERQVLLLTAIQQLDHAEVAAALAKSPSATRALLFRARTRLRERLTRKGLLP